MENRLMVAMDQAQGWNGRKGGKHGYKWAP